MTENTLKDAAFATPDPERSLNNLTSFIKENPGHADRLGLNLRPVSVLFSCSQFLANYCATHPDVLFSVLEDINSPRSREELAVSLRNSLAAVSLSHAHRTSSKVSLDPQMSVLREFKTREVLGIMIRDITKKADLVDVMLELSILADVIIDNSLDVVKASMQKIYGDPENDAFSVIALGKLGGEELNFSSDVDLMFLYRTEAGETTGVRTGQGVTVNRISNHEYYCKMGETLTRFISMNTASGFAYRVDLRLRPEGQRGDIALALRGYEMYYESWGRAWERAMLIRARPVAGDHELGQDFIGMVRPFVYRKYLDFSSIDEISSLKTRIDSTFKKGDIKRGYGGIREIEFFAQALQLIYGGREPLLRERSTLKALHRLQQKELLGREDYSILSENYQYLRTLEHRLQQLNDLQTHTLPQGEAELKAVSRKMGFREKRSFMNDLELRRSAVRNVYDSLFARKNGEVPSGNIFFDEELPDAELREYLLHTGLRDPDRAIRNIKAIKGSILNFQTLRGRRLLGEVLPMFVDSALKSGGPDMSLNQLQSFAQFLSSNESYLEIFSRNRTLIVMLTYVFSQSEYLSKMLMSKPKYLEMIGWQEVPKKSLLSLKSEITAGIGEGHPVNEVIRSVRQTEEIRLGLLFLQKKAEISDVIKGLSRTAEAILSVCIKDIVEGGGEMAVIGFGKLGGREISFNSDLDVIFVSSDETGQLEAKAAERFLRMLISYTREGVAYRVDTRLRPEGSKGPLVSSVESFRKYYAKAAAFWEFQALLKARPVAGNRESGLAFMQMAKDTLLLRGREINADDIRQMRERIVRELSKEPEGYDIKLGPGGIEEIEFTVQYLQLSNCGQHEKLLVQGTMPALGRLHSAGVIQKEEASFLEDAYVFYRSLESFLRLRKEGVLKREDDKLANASGFMGYSDVNGFIARLEQTRKRTGEIYGKYVAGQ